MPIWFRRTKKTHPHGLKRKCRDPRTPAAAETVEETAATEAGGKVEKTQEDAGATVKGGEFTIGVKKLFSHFFCRNAVFFFFFFRS